MKRRIILILSWILIIQIFFVSADSINIMSFAMPLKSQPQITLNAKGAVMVEEKTGKILYEKDAKKQLYPASITKILTALIAIEKGDLDEVVTVGDEIMSLPEDASRAGLTIGEQITLRNLIFSLMLPSGNDAACTIAVYIIRKITNNTELKAEEALNLFSKLMNERAMQAGAKDSNFVTPHGYHDPGHFSTAYDLAVIAREAMKNAFFKEVVGTQSLKLKGGNNIHEWINTNLLLNKDSKNFYYSYAEGIKTGYTAQAGYCLAASAVKDNMELIAVILDDSEDGRFTDSKTLLELGFDNFQYYNVVGKGQFMERVKVKDHASDDTGELGVVSDGEFTDIYAKDDISRIKKENVWDNELVISKEESIDEIQLKAPILKGQKLGKAVYRLDGNIITEVNLLAERDIKRKTLIDEVKSINGLIYLFWVFAVAFGLFVTIQLIKRQG